MSEPVKKPIKFDSEDVYAINVPILFLRLYLPMNLLRKYLYHRM